MHLAAAVDDLPRVRRAPRPGRRSLTSGSNPRIFFVLAISSSPSAEPCALPVFCSVGAGQPMIVRTAMNDGLSVTRCAFLIASSSADDVLTGVDALHVPAVGLVAREHVLAECDRRVVLDRDVVVVVEQDQVAEFLVPGERGRLARNALFHAAVAGDDVDEVVERRLARRGVGVEQATLAARCHRHAHAVGDALAERAGSHLDAGGVVVLGVARRARLPRPQRLEVGQFEAVAGQEQLAVLRQRRVPVGQDEPVAADPLRIGRIVTHHALIEQVGQRRQAHRRAGMAAAGLLDCVCGEQSRGVDRLGVEVGPPLRVHGVHAFGLAGSGSCHDCRGPFAVQRWCSVRAYPFCQRSHPV